jgi:hypothetical protein
MPKKIMSMLMILPVACVTFFSLEEFGLSVYGPGSPSHVVEMKMQETL